MYSMHIAEINLLDCLKHSMDDDIKSKAIEALGVISAGHPNTIEAIKPHTTSDSLKVRFSAVKALGRLRADSCEVCFIKALHDENWTVRREACFALRAVGTVGSIGSLTRALTDPDYDVRMAASSAFHAINQRSKQDGD